MDIYRTPDARFADLPDFPFEPRYTEVQGLRMHHVEAGPPAADPVLLLHGEPTWSYLYRKMIPVIAAAGHRVLAPDLIGFGRSDKPTRTEDYSYAKHVEWTAGWIRENALRNITLVVQDWGSLIGLRLVGQQPELFSRVVVANGFLPTGEGALPAIFRAWRAFARWSPVFPISAIVRAGCVQPLSHGARKAYDAPFPTRRSKAGARAFPRLVPVGRDDPGARENREAWAGLRSWDKPFLTAFATGDPIFRGLDRALQQRIPGAEGQPHTRVRGAGHFIQEDRGEELARIVVEFTPASSLQTRAGMPVSPTVEIDHDEIRSAVRGGEGVRCSLPRGGVLSIDRGLPYLLLHRQRPGHEDTGTARLVSGEASYLLGGEGHDEEITALVRSVAEAGAEAYGAFLVLEVWSAADPHGSVWTVHGPAGPAPETVGALVEGLRVMPGIGSDLSVELDTGDTRHPPGLDPLLSVHEGWEREILLLGLEVPPVYRDPETAEVYPRFLRRLQSGLSDVLRRTAYEFIRVQTTCKVANYRALGTSNVPRSIWHADRELSAIERSFDFLLMTSPVNNDAAWREFEQSGFDDDPEFKYRLLSIDPDLLKRRLFAIEMEAIDDPALSSLFQDKRQELDRQLSMLDERRTPAFLLGSMRLYGAVDPRLLEMAQSLLSTLPAIASNRGAPRARVDAEGFRAAAEREFAYYAARHAEIATREITVRPDLVGLMVSEGNLLIGESLRLNPARVPALIHHEVGTHVLTYVNGAAQPMEQLSLGLADYDELQEGLAVLSEYLVGGLYRSRMRLLAARVVAAHAVEQGAGFVDTFRLLTRDHGFSERGAWHVAARVHACGGFTRDLIYLRGLVGLLDHLASGGELEPLYIGKIALKHVTVLEELRHRAVLVEPPLTPRFLEDAEARRRLALVRDGITLTELVSPETE